MRRSPVAVAAALAALALTAAACGGSGKSANSSTPATTSASASGSGSGAGGILGAIDTKASTGPQKIKLDVTVDIKGAPKNAQLALFTKQPIHLGLDGVVDSSAKSADLNISLTLGTSPLAAEIRTGGGKSWIQIEGKWYDLPASVLSSTTGTTLPAGVSTSNLDAGKILAAIGDPAKLLDNASVSSDKVEGIDADKVSGDVNIAAVAAAAANLSQSVGTGTAQAPTQAEIDKTVTQLKKIVNKAHVDLWVGKSDHKVHRVVFTLDAAMDAATKASSGIDSATVNLDVTTVDASAPDISAPSSVGTPAEFQAALMGLLGKVMGGATGPSLWSRSVRPRPQLVLLDVDFTLIRPRRVFDADGYAELGARFGARLDPGRYEQARLDALHVWRVATLERRTAQHRLFAVEIVRGMGAGRDEAEQIGIAAEEAWGDPTNFELFPDVEPLFEILRASGCTVGLVSNTDRELVSFAAQLGISVDFALASHAHGRRKPCTTIFAAALALGGAPAEAAVMVGDSLDDDIAGAAGSGLRAVLVDRQGRYPEHPGERVAGLDELPALLGLKARAATPPAGL
jgi:HAD superfamily hydrolase (TIGR01549 family)